MIDFLYFSKFKHILGKIQSHNIKLNDRKNVLNCYMNSSFTYYTHLVGTLDTNLSFISAVDTSNSSCSIVQQYQQELALLFLALYWSLLLIISVEIHFNCKHWKSNYFAAKDGNSLKNQFLELFILGNSKEYSKKLFNSWEVLQAYITCTFLYGNTFILGVDSGIVSLYKKRVLFIKICKSFAIMFHKHIFLFCFINTSLF